MWKWQHTYDTFVNAVQGLTPHDLELAQAAAADVRAEWTADGKGRLTQHRDLIRQFRKRLKQDLPENHIGLAALNLTTEEWTLSARATSQRTADHNEQQQIISPATVNAIVTRASQHLTDSDWRQVTIALAILTGRRMSEIIKTATLKKGSAFSVWFSGAIKRGGEIDTLCYEIPTLCAADDVINALRWLRLNKPTDDLSIPQCNRFSGELNIACEQFNDLIPPPTGKDQLNLHRLRGLYAAIATFFYCPTPVAEAEFRAHIMGHFQADDGRPLRERRSLTSDRHYLSYAIADDNGTQRKGVRLDWHHVSVLEDFQPMNNPEPTPTIKDPRSRKRYTVAFWDHDRKRLETLLDAIAPDNNPQFPLSKSERLEQLLDWIENKLQQPLPLHDSDSITQTLAQHSQSLETLSHDIVQLSTLVSQQAHPEMQARIEHLEQENQQLSEERDLLHNKLSAIYQSLGLSLPEGTTPTGTDRYKSQPPIRTNHDGSASTPIMADGANAPDSKLERASIDGLDPDIVRAIYTVMDYNDNVAQAHNQKWAIAVQPLQQLLSTIGKGTNTKIMKAIKQLRKDIDEHHFKHALGQRHNKCHNGHSILDVIKL